MLSIYYRDISYHCIVIISLYSNLLDIAYILNIILSYFYYLMYFGIYNRISRHFTTSNWNLIKSRAIFTTSDWNNRILIASFLLHYLILNFLNKCLNGILVNPFKVKIFTDLSS